METRYGRWVVLGPDPPRKVFCRCDCGTERSVDYYTLRYGKSRSCGCIASEVTRRRNLIHGLTGTREHDSWIEARRRCFDPRRKSFRHYGARGITMCDEWRHDFMAFLNALGPCPPGLTLERIDNNRGYEPGNCKWATRLEQSNNRRYPRFIERDGKRLSLAAWERELGLTPGTLRRRLHRHWTIERAMSEPVHVKHRSISRSPVGPSRPSSWPHSDGGA